MNIIPCHRVVGTGGKLTGYAGEIDKKIKLLEFEKCVDIHKIKKYTESMCIND